MQRSERLTHSDSIDTILRMDLVAIAIGYNIPREIAIKRLEKAVAEMKIDSEAVDRPLKRVRWNKGYAGESAIL